MTTGRRRVTNTIKQRPAETSSVATAVGVMVYALITQNADVAAGAAAGLVPAVVTVIHHRGLVGVAKTLISGDGRATA